MRGLFLRIFLAVWLAMTVAGATFALVYASDPMGHRRGFGHDGLRMLGESALIRMEAGHTDDVRRDLVSVSTRTRMRVYVLDDGRLIVGSGRPSPETLEAARQAEQQHKVIEVMNPETSYNTVAVPLRTGAIVTIFPPRPSRAEMILGTKETLPIRLAVVFVAVGIVAYLLARYLTKPLSHLRGAAQRLADGDLTVRVSPTIEGATEEIAALGRDFDRMAERIAALLEGQERLLRDVSHELRSPLARLTVALALARKRVGDTATSELDRIEREAERLAEMISLLLTLARLSDDAHVPEEHVDLTAIVEDVVRDADYEARGMQRHVELAITARPEIRGFHQPLRSAVENVVRNAVAFTEEGSTVQVSLDVEHGHVLIRVRDHGPGVPDDALEAIFRPFYRVGTDRDRRTGGTGLGLAIASRVVKRHAGTISARNLPTKGLEIAIDLPVT